MESPGFNYFSCTSEQASELKHKYRPGFKTIIRFLDLASKSILRHVPAMGFAETDAPVYTFYDIRDCSMAAAEKLSPSLIKAAKNKGVALLAYNSPALVFAWLGLMRLGCVVFFISPAYTADTIASICERFALSALFYDPCYKTLAEQFTKVEGNRGRVLPIVLPFDGTIKDFPGHDPASPQVPILPHQNKYAYAKCVPKPVWGKPSVWKCSQSAAIGVRPCIDGRGTATFSAKPLHYGAIEDCLRAWSSGSMIWLLPAAKMPVTFASLGESTSEIMKRQKTVTQKGTKLEKFPEVKYFSAPDELDVYKWINETEKGYAFARGLDFVRHGDEDGEVLHQLGLAFPLKTDSRRMNNSKKESDRRMPELLSAKRSREPDGSRSPIKKRARPVDGGG